MNVQAKVIDQSCSDYFVIGGGSGGLASAVSIHFRAIYYLNHLHGPKDTNDVDRGEPVLTVPRSVSLRFLLDWVVLV